jgi:DNA-directed RNA polymerase subunit RPC12/RpoP
MTSWKCARCGVRQEFVVDQPCQFCGSMWLEQEAPVDLIVMRLADMHRVHPRQDNSRVCGTCGQQVGIYPSGQAMLRHHSDTAIVCSVCSAARPVAETILAPGVVEELFESVPAEPTEGVADDQGNRE